MRVQKFIGCIIFVSIQRCAFELNFEIEESAFLMIFFEDNVFLLHIQHIQVDL